MITNNILLYGYITIAVAAESSFITANNEAQWALAQALQNLGAK